MVETRNSTKIKEDQNPRKLYSRFLFKALILAVFCSVVPVFLSQTPELSSQTRLLELLHLILVGIAVSYGLFSRRNYDEGGGGGGGGTTNNDHKTDHNSYVPKILEVPSSVFNVHHQESESEPSDDSSSGDYSKIQTWKNKHHMKIPEIILSKDHDEEKPLLLPVRSLNHSLRVSDSGRWEKVRSKRQLLKSLGGDDDDNSDVLPSPIPWRSRSSSSTEIESQPSIKNPITVESLPLIRTPTNLTSSPRKSTPLPEFGAKSAEDIARRHNFHGDFHPPPPPPPPPPLPAFYNGNYRSKSRESAHKTKFGNGEFHPPPPPPPPPPVDYYKSPPTRLRVSRKQSESKAKSDERSSKRNSIKKVWWSDPIVESKEHGIIRQDTEKNSYLGSKTNEESENEEQRRRRRRESEIHENDEIKEKKIIEEEEEGVCESSNGSDVDKKADEFIAKFREQIRLQRIESIKRSANKISANSSR